MKTLFPTKKRTLVNIFNCGFLNWKNVKPSTIIASNLTRKRQKF